MWLTSAVPPAVLVTLNVRMIWRRTYNDGLTLSARVSLLDHAQ